MRHHGSVTLFRVRGIPVRAHWTLLLLVPYFALVLSTQLDQLAGGAGGAGAPRVLPAPVWGLVLMIGIFASIGAHEVAHALVALRTGGQVRSITLMLIGGISRMTRMPRRARAEALMAAAGPLTSLALGALLLIVAPLTTAWPADLRLGLAYLGTANLVLGAFNLIPAFPMDGGRILRTILTRRAGRAEATRIAAAVGAICAVGMAAIGLWTGNLLLLLIAFFVYAGGNAELEAERARTALDGLPIASLVPVLRGAPPIIGATASIREALSRMWALGRPALAVVDGAGQPLAVTTASDLAATPAIDHARLTVGDVATRHPHPYVRVAAELDANDALARAEELEAAYLVVDDAQGVLALLTWSDIATMIGLCRARQGFDGAPGRRLRPPRLARARRWFAARAVARTVCGVGRRAGVAAAQARAMLGRVS